MPPLLTPLADWVRRRAALRRAARSAAKLIPDVPWTVSVEALGPVRIRLRRHRWFLWERFGRMEGMTFAAFDRLVRDGDVFYDIGANIGVYTRVVRQWFHAGPVVAIEPMTENFDLLEENIRLGGGRDMHAFRMALSDRSGEEVLQVDDMTSGTAVLSSVSGGEASQGRRLAGLPPRGEQVRIERLDDLIVREGLPAPQVMKIDTEGAEVKVLAGAEQTLREHAPKLAIALHGVDKAEGTIQLLDDLGYVCAGEVKESGGRTWRRLRASDAARLGNNNIIAAVDPDLVLPPLQRRAPGVRPPQADRELATAAAT